MKHLAIRLKEGECFREGIEAAVKAHDIRAGVILSAVGGIHNAIFRLPKFESGEHPVKEIDGPFEIVSCTGTITADGCHIHAAVANREGQCFGGHLKEGCRVFCTIELVIGIFEDTTFRRIPDPETGFAEFTP